MLTGLDAFRGVDPHLDGQPVPVGRGGSSARLRGDGGTGQWWELSLGVTASSKDIFPVNPGTNNQRVCETPLRQSLK